jgi:hypothetical protein
VSEKYLAHAAATAGLRVGTLGVRFDLVRPE